MTFALHSKLAAVLFVGLLGVAAFATVPPLQLWVLQKAEGAAEPRLEPQHRRVQSRQCARRVARRRGDRARPGAGLGDVDRGAGDVVGHCRRAVERTPGRAAPHRDRSRHLHCQLTTCVCHAAISLLPVVLERAIRRTQSGAGLNLIPLSPRKPHESRRTHPLPAHRRSAIAARCRIAETVAADGPRSAGARRSGVGESGRHQGTFAQIANRSAAEGAGLRRRGRGRSGRRKRHPLQTRRRGVLRRRHHPPRQQCAVSAGRRAPGRQQAESAGFRAGRGAAADRDHRMGTAVPAHAIRCRTAAAMANRC